VAKRSSSSCRYNAAKPSSRLTMSHGKGGGQVMWWMTPRMPPPPLRKSARIQYTEHARTWLLGIKRFYRLACRRADIVIMSIRYPSTPKLIRPGVEIALILSVCLGSRIWRYACGGCRCGNTSPSALTSRERFAGPNFRVPHGYRPFQECWNAALGKTPTISFSQTISRAILCSGTRC